MLAITQHQPPYDLPGELGEPAADVGDYQLLGDEIDERMRGVDLVGPGCGRQLVIDHLGRSDGGLLILLAAGRPR